MRAGRRLRRPRASPYVIALIGRIVLVYGSRALPASPGHGGPDARRGAVRRRLVVAAAVAAASDRIPTAHGNVTDATAATCPGNAADQQAGS
jgi:hypothetical protein